MGWTAGVGAGPRMKTLDKTLFGRTLGKLADLVIHHRWLFLFPQLLLFGLCVLYTKNHLNFDPNQDDLVGSGKKYHQNYLKFKKEFPTQDDLVVVVESDNPEKNRQFVERLGARLEVETNLFTDVLYRNDFKMLGRKALLFASEDDLKELRNRLTDYLPFIRQFTQVTNLASLFEMVNSQFLNARRERNANVDALIKAVPMLDGIVKQATESLQRPGTPPSPGITALFGAGDQDIYIIPSSTNLQIYLVTAQAKREDLNGDAVDELRRLVARTELEVPGLNVGITGEPVLDHDQMEQSKADTTVASIACLILCALIFIYGYQETGRPLKATFCLIIGMGYTLAFTTFAIGHLNILTVTFLPILIGLAIDFGVHLITRYEEELRLGRGEEAAMRKAMVFTGQGIFTGALTTAAAFLAMGLTNFKGIQEMGVICGGGMLISFVPMMTMLPVLLFRGRQNAMDLKTLPKPELRSRIENFWLRRPVAIVLVTSALCVLALSQFYKVHFDYDLLNMQSKGLPAVVYEQKLINSADKSVLFAAVVADTPQQAVELEQSIRKLPSVQDVDSMAPRLIGDQSKKLQLIGDIKQAIATLEFLPVDPESVQLSKLSAILYSTYGFMGSAAANKDAQNDPELVRQLTSLHDSINELRKQMFAIDSARAVKQLTSFQQALFNDVRDTFDAFRNQDDSSPLQAKDLPPALRHRFIGVTGKYLLQVYPKDDVWRRDNQAEFVKELQTEAPDVTGTPVQLYYYTELLKKSYIQAAYYSLAAIALMVAIHFRTVSSVILALLPVAIGSIWMGGLMGAFGIAFNPANIMTLPLVIGIGVTNGIHILNRVAEEGNPGILSKSTGKAVFVSGLTAIAGFGSLILAKHQGIRSLGVVMSMGVALCMIAALTFLPAVLNLIIAWRRLPKKQPSGDNARSTLGREEPR